MSLRQGPLSLSLGKLLLQQGRLLRLLLLARGRESSVLPPMGAALLLQDEVGLEDFTAVAVGDTKVTEADSRHLITHPIDTYPKQLYCSVTSHNLRRIEMAHHLHKSEPAGEAEPSKVKVAASKGKEEKHHKHMEQLAQLGAVAAGAYALHEKHQAKKEPEQAKEHKVRGGVAAALAVGSAGLALHERHQRKSKAATETAGDH
ncbi:hypothetical protein ZWY2020_026367 [Hordeum vulgare]|nr:hypothetical protein ZWY2020_026367 [Hordeum vulgare]